MWVKTGVEQMLSWIEKKKQPTFYSGHTSVWKAIWERLLQVPRDHVTLRHVPAHLGLSDVETGILSKEDWEGNRAADEQAKKGAKKSEPPQQMMSEKIRRRHMVQNAQMAAIHKLEWRTTISTLHERQSLMEMLEEEEERERDRHKPNCCISARETEVMGDGTLRMSSRTPEGRLD